MKDIKIYEKMVEGQQGIAMRHLIQLLDDLKVVKGIMRLNMHRTHTRPKNDFLLQLWRRE